MASPLSFSFELGSAADAGGVAKLPAVIGQLAAVRPNYFSVTYGAGGSDQDGTYETLMAVVEHSRHGGGAAPDLRWLDARAYCRAAGALPRCRA